ncbi:hypothetical protein [Cylindrospermopsis raciborskii]|uniref:hypothetical protein n=1 Tax=Cylindrospermopsis raciborskii TaxID=77022 RepID=UPI0038CFC537
MTQILSKLKKVIIAAENYDEISKILIINDEFSNQDLMQIAEYWWETMDWGYPWICKAYLDFDYQDMKKFSSWINKKELLQDIDEGYNEEKSDELFERISDESFETIMQRNLFNYYHSWVDTMFDNMSSRDKTIHRMSEKEYQEFERLIIKHSPDEAFLENLKDYVIKWAEECNSDIRYRDFEAFIKWTKIKNVEELRSADEGLDDLYGDWIDEIYDSLDKDTQRILDLPYNVYLQEATGYSYKQIALLNKAIAKKPTNHKFLKET